VCQVYANKEQTLSDNNRVRQIQEMY